MADLLRAAGEHDAEGAAAAAESLRAWIVRGGFVPVAAFTAMTESEVRIVLGLIIDGADARWKQGWGLGSDLEPVYPGCETGSGRICVHGNPWGSNDCGQCDGFNRPIKRRKGGGK